MFYKLIVKSKTSFLDRLFTYASDEKLESGTRVIVPFGNADVKRIGIIVEEIDEKPDFPAKKITEVLDSNPLISEELLDIALYMIKNNLSDYSSAINTVLPPGSADKVKEFFRSKESLKPIDEDLYNFLSDYKTFEDIEKEFPGKYKKSEISDLSKKNYLKSYISLMGKSSIKYKETVYLLDNDYDDKIRKNSHKQKAILDYLQDQGPADKKVLLGKTKTSTASLNSLLEKDLITIKKEKVYRNVLDKVEDFKKIKLNLDQERVYKEILNSEDDTFLLHGVTGSGKTEIYLQLVEKCINDGKEAIILVPEISLTPQTIARFQGRFGNQIAVLHSKLTLSERADQWRMIKNKEVKIVIGARSAIFAPFENIGLIVIDEEHEDSYKSDKNPKYSAIEIAKLRVKYHKAKLLLASATPSVKSYYEAEQGKIRLLELKNRVNNLAMPNIEIVDMREELKKNNFSMFSLDLQDKIEKALANKEQIILFLNKRGYSSFVFCRKCGYVHKCEACDVAMTYHMSKERLICHYCGRTARKQKRCINCGSTWIKEFGAGTEMLEMETKKMFPHARVKRMDADTTSKKDDYEEVYRQMNDHEIDILIGTQMLAKGLDFPNVSVVGIISADVSLNIPDFRSGEKTFNLITQVAGRSGRGNVGGNVLIQTYNASHYAIKNAADHDYKKYYKEEIGSRKTFHYPPYVKILNINISSKDRFYAINFGRKIAQKTNEFIREKSADIIEITGPTPSLIEKINNRYRFDIIIKSYNKNDLIKLANVLRNFRDQKVYVNFKLEED
ncbi:primosomal protein N' [uncultured Helcococcus sp.]|uniref:primosomal protein N' n=1 Tax=uncultured Helcococcus sp. TaxID=1072508 RepID=UPI00288B8E0F|nr:primosomal protein N' [uncultured Helcococcus sp.]